MQEKDFYHQILGLKSPWFVADVKLDTVCQQVDAFVEHPAATKFCCPECQRKIACYDHTSARTWRHLEVLTQQLLTGKVWAYKETLRDLWHHETAVEAGAYFTDSYRGVIHTKPAPMKKVARTIKERLANVASYCTPGITNAVAERINSKIQSVKRRVGGYRNKENDKTAIFFHCGGVDLHPH